MKILQLLTAAAILATSTSAMARWKPFDNDNNRYNNRGNNYQGSNYQGNNNRWDNKRLQR